MSSDFVWYASFGSNLRRERFMHYLRGGALEGQGIGHHGARDSSDPTADRIGEISHQLRFGGESKRWGGGVAFLDPSEGSGRAVVRLWKVTGDQFNDVAAQENGLTPGDLEVDHPAVEQAGHLDVVDRWYGRVLFLGRVDELPVFTFTSPNNRRAVAPGPAYLTTILTGLLEMGVNKVNAASYLMEAPGVADAWTIDSLLELVDA